MKDRRDDCRDGDRGPTEWVARYRSSGLSLRDFAKRQGLSVGRLHYWVYGKRCDAAVIGPAVRFQEVKLGELMPGPNWVAEVGLRGGVTVRVSGAVPAAWVVEVVRGLGATC
jgi:hypothetical protein